MRIASVGKKVSCLLALWVAGSGFWLNAQNVTDPQQDPTVTRSGVQHTAFLGQVTFSECEDKWDPFLKTTQKHHTPGVDVAKDEMNRLKAEANALRDNSTSSSQKVNAGAPPTLGSTFFGNTYNFADPADNAVAVSASGRVISGSNTRIHIYDSSGAAVSTTSLFGFSSSLSLPSNFLFDPKITYDPIEDRFVVVFLAGTNSSNSRVVVAFSTSGDPNGSWNMYALNGNPFNNGTWTDFPVIGLSTDELFITGNLFDSQPASQGSVIWQINKADGYAGNALTFVTHQTQNYFSIHPVEGGMNLYGPHFYFIRSVSGQASGEIHLHRMTNTASNGGVLESPLAFQMSNSYTIPPSADQKGSTADLRTNESRIQSSYFENNRIQFTLNTGLAGTPAIFYGTGEISPFLLSFSSFTGQYISYPGIHAAYGAVAYAGEQHSSGVNHSFVMFNFCGPDEYPGVACAYVDENGISDMVVCRPGNSYLSSQDNRWGDYADIAERPGHPGEAWVAGTFSNTSHQQRTYIAEVGPPALVAVEDEIEDQAELEIYPNPSVDRVLFRFPVDIAGTYDLYIRDLQGRVMKKFNQYDLRLGVASLSFMTTELSTGTYLVSVENEERTLFTKKLVVAR